MKKIILCFAICLMTLSCSEEALNENHCYKINYIMHTNNGDVTMEEYHWMNSEMADWQKQRYEEMGYTGVSITRKIGINTFEECWMTDTTTHLCGKIKF